MSVIVALDAGTGGAKCAVFDLAGRLCALHRESWDYTVVADAATPFVKAFSFDPELFWSILCRCARQALCEAAIPAGEVIGIATTSQREGCVFLDAGGKELYAGPNLDSRGFEEGLEVLAALGLERLYEITGHSAPFIFPIARYLWFRKHDQRQVAHILMINDWMTYRLCGTLSAEPSNATESMLFDFRRRQWSAEILDMFDIPKELLPPIHACGERLGVVGQAAATATGLAAGTPVFAGGADTQCALLGTGAVQAGDTAVILGTTTPIQSVVARPTLDPAANLWAGCHVLPDRWVIEANVGGTGDAYEWLLDLLVHTSGDRYSHAEKLATEACEQGTFTYIGPRIFDLTKLRPDIPGGIFFRFPTMQLRPRPGEILRAFLASIAFAVRANLLQLEPVTGVRAQRLLVGGGMSRNRLLLRLLSDITGLTVCRAGEAESTALGCAILVAAGAGVFADATAAAGAMCRHIDIEPDGDCHERYDDAFAKWRELYDHLDTLSI